MSEYGTFEDFYNTFKKWSKKDILRRTYDIAQESIQKGNIIKEVREYIKGACYLDEINYPNSLGHKQTMKVLEILDKENK